MTNKSDSQYSIHPTHQKLYICKCGKYYQSYTSLHHHIKLKHPTRKFQNQSKQFGNNLWIDFEMGQLLESEQSNKMYQNKIIQYLNRIKQWSERYEVREIIWEVLGEQSSIYILQGLRRQIEQTRQKKLILVNKLEVYEISMEDIFFELLSIIQNKIHGQIFLQMIILFLIWKRYLQKNNLSLNGAHIIEKANQLILTFIPQQIKSYNVPQITLLKQTPQHKIKLAKLFCFISHWLFNKKYTNSLIKLHQCIH